MIKFNFRLSVKNNLGLFWFRFTLHWNWFELSVCHLFDQSDSKLKPTAILSLLSCDISVILIACCEYFAFDFSTLKQS